MATNLTSIPTVTGVIDQQFLIEALGGPQNPRALLDRFPDALYNKAPESHLVRLLYALIGSAGLGQLKNNALQTRLLFEDHGIELFDLEAFYGNPFQFGRIISETYDQDPTGLLTDSEWDQIRAKDSRYRSRAVDFFNGVRAGNSPLGMRLVARSGLGYDVEIIENYRALFDGFSDDPLGIPYYGQTLSTEEMIVLPRRETDASSVQKITFNGSPSSGIFQLTFNGYVTSALSIDPAAPTYDGVTFNPGTTYFADRFTLQAALERLPSIGKGNIRVDGGISVTSNTTVIAPYVVTFIGTLSGQEIPLFSANDPVSGTSLNGLTGGTNPSIAIESISAGTDSSVVTMEIGPRDLHSLEVALDRVKPVTTIPTTHQSPGTRKAQAFITGAASSENARVTRFVTGQPGVTWPSNKSYYWIQKNIEIAAPRPPDGSLRAYQGFHNIPSVSASSEHVGHFNSAQAAIFPFLAARDDDTLVYTADRCLADYAEVLTTQGTATDAGSGSSVALIQGIYPSDYAALPGVAKVRYKDDQFWSSAEAVTGTETLTLDLGAVQAINFLAFECSNKPVSISVTYDALDQEGRYLWESVLPEANIPFPNSVSYTPEHANPWSYREYHFTQALGGLIFTRYIQIAFARTNSDFVSGNPWSIEVRNLRIGRNVS